MAQTTKDLTHAWVSDGAKISIKAPADSVFTDIGTVKGGFPLTYEYDVLSTDSGNGPRLIKQYFNQRLSGEAELYDNDPAIIEKFMAGQMEKVETAGTPVSTIPDQVIAANWVSGQRYQLDMITSPSDSTKLKMPTGVTPTFTSITLDLGGTPEVLTEVSGKYSIVPDTDAPSGNSIVFNSGPMSTGSPETLPITINFGANTPVARTTLYLGETSGEFENYELKIEHTDKTGLVRGFHVFSVAPEANGLEFGILGADSQEFETTKLKFAGEIDENLTNGRKLMSMYSDTGAK